MMENNENVFAYELNFGGNAEKALNEIADKFTEIESSLKDTKIGSDKLSSSLSDIDDKPLDDAAKAAGDLAKKQEEATKATKKLDDAQGKLKDSFSKVKESGANFAKILAGVGAAAIGATYSIFKMVNSQTELGDQQAKIARNLGMSISAYSEIAYVTDMAGVPAEKLRVALSALARNAVMDKDAFKQLGVSVMDMSGNLKPTNELFMEIGDKLRTMPDRAKASGLAMRVMGEQGAAMISAFGSSAADWDDVADRGKKLGFVLSEEFGSMSETYQDSIANVQKSLGSFSRSIVVGIAPSMSVFFETLADKFSALSDTEEGGRLSNSISKIADKLMKLALTLADNIPLLLSVFDSMVNLAEPFVNLASLIAESDTALKLFGMTVASVFSAMALKNIMKFVSSIGSMATAFWDVKKAATAAAAAQGVAGAGGKAAIGNTVGSIAGKAGIYGALISVGAIAWSSAISDFLKFMKEKASANKEAKRNIEFSTRQGEISDLKMAIKKEKDPMKRFNLQRELGAKEHEFNTMFSKELFGEQNESSEASKEITNAKYDNVINNYNTSITQTNTISSDISKVGQLLDQKLDKLVLSQFRYKEIGSRIIQLGGA